jgi:hypothetical protein
MIELINPKRVRGAQPGNRNARKHGHHSRKVKLTDVGLMDISQQNGPGRLIAQKAEAIFHDGGGRENFSELKQDLVSRYLITELLIQSLDRWLLEQKSLVNRRKKAAFPILAERSRLTETSLKLAQAIGLDRRAAPVIETCPVCRAACLEHAGQLQCPGCRRFPTLCACVPPECDSELGTTPTSSEILERSSRSSSEEKAITRDVEGDEDHQ